MNDEITYDRKITDYLFTSTNILKIASDSLNFREWLKNYHHIRNDKELYQGYRFFIITSIKFMLYAISINTSSCLKSDFIFRRAEFTGVPIEDIPNTCEQIVLMKNIWGLTEDIRYAKNWNEINNAINKLEQVFTIVNKLYRCAEVTDNNFEKDYVLKIQTMYHTVVYFNDTKRGFPQALITPVIIVPMVKEEQFDNAYKGYVYTLQYLWFKLLGEVEYEKKCVKALHEPIKDKKKISDYLGFNQYDRTLSPILLDNKTRLYQ